MPAISTPTHRLLAATVLLIAALACSDNGSSSSDVRLTYDDGTTSRLATDSALVAIHADSSLIARAWFSPQSSPEAFTLELGVDSLGGLSLPPGEYDVDTGLPLSFSVSLRNATLIATPTSGTITIETSTDTQIAGSLDLAFEYIQFPATQPASFTLRGRFRFSVTETIPGP